MLANLDLYGGEGFDRSNTSDLWTGRMLLLRAAAEAAPLDRCLARAYELSIFKWLSLPLAAPDADSTAFQQMVALGMPAQLDSLAFADLAALDVFLSNHGM